MKDFSVAEDVCAGEEPSGMDPRFCLRLKALTPPKSCHPRMENQSHKFLDPYVENHSLDGRAGCWQRYSGALASRAAGPAADFHGGNVSRFEADRHAAC